MSKKFQLSIPTPCHENWDNMTPVEKGRFCVSCQKQVVDFSRMSDREIAMFFKKPSTGSVCGRFMEDQLDRDIEIPKKRIPWIKYFFQFALPAFLVSAKASAQGKIRIKAELLKETKCTQVLGNAVPGIITKELMTKDTLIPCKLPDLNKIIITGKVVDEKGEDVVGASVVIQNPKFVGTRTDGSGNFKLEMEKQNDSVAIEASSVGYRNEKIFISPNETSNQIVLQLKTQEMGEVVVVGWIRKKAKPLPLLPLIVKKDEFHAFKVFPNPVQSGTSLNIEWPQSEEGEYILQLLDQGGQLIFNKAMWIDKDARVLNLEVPHVAAGNYFLRMTNKYSGKSYAEKIIIQ